MSYRDYDYVFSQANTIKFQCKWCTAVDINKPKSKKISDAIVNT